MEPIWRDLPLDLSDKVCNHLRFVRQIDPVLKKDIHYARLSRIAQRDLETSWVIMAGWLELEPKLTCRRKYSKRLSAGWDSMTPNQRDELFYFCIDNPDIYECAIICSHYFLGDWVDMAIALESFFPIFAPQVIPYRPIFMNLNMYSEMIEGGGWRYFIAMLAN